jgi:phage shock protein C
MILGVCKGIAVRYDVPVFWIRAGVIFIMITTAVWPVVLAYFLIAFFIKPEPVIPFSDESDSEFYGSYTNSRSMALHRVKKKFDQLNNRIRRMEDVVTSRDFTWDQKLGER